jgi:hypothetical protein
MTGGRKIQMRDVISRNIHLTSRPRDNVLLTAAACNAPARFLSAELCPEMNRVPDKRILKGLGGFQMRVHHKQNMILLRINDLTASNIKSAMANGRNSS